MKTEAAKKTNANDTTEANAQQTEDIRTCEIVRCALSANRVRGGLRTWWSHIRVPCSQRVGAPCAKRARPQRRAWYTRLGVPVGGTRVCIKGGIQTN